MTQYYSQIGQDRWVVNLFRNKKGLYFLDIGAHDGIQLSNTYFLEKKLEWNGLCVEPNKISYEKLVSNRKCKTVNKAIYKFDGKIEFTEDDMGSHIDRNFGKDFVECVTFETLFRTYNVPKIINYMSLDVEGIESEILETFPFEEYECVCMTVEHNLYMGDSSNKNKIYRLLSSNNYKRVEEDVCDRGSPLEDWYIHEKFLNFWRE